jgi:hypothetical protein
MDTYENDKDFNQLLSAKITDELLLDFIFKKRKVNATNVSHLYLTRCNRHIAPHFHNLAAKGLIKPVDSHHYQITWKAKWRSFYQHPSWVFWATIISFLALVASIIAIVN